MSVVIGTRYSAVSALLTNPRRIFRRQSLHRSFSFLSVTAHPSFFRSVPSLFTSVPLQPTFFGSVPSYFLSTTKFLSCRPRLLPTVLTLPLVPTLPGVVVIQRVLNIRPTVVAKAVRQSTEDLNTEDLNTEDLNSEDFFLLDYEQCY